MPSQGIFEDWSRCVDLHLQKTNDWNLSQSIDGFFCILSTCLFSFPFSGLVEQPWKILLPMENYCLNPLWNVGLWNIAVVLQMSPGAQGFVWSREGFSTSAPKASNEDNWPYWMISREQHLSQILQKTVLYLYIYCSITPFWKYKLFIITSLAWTKCIVMLLGSSSPVVF